jgi:hypothetical protein
MSDSPEIPEKPVEPEHFRKREYEDPHYHDDDEVLPPDDEAGRGHRLPVRRKPSRRPPPRRPYHAE